MKRKSEGDTERQEMIEMQERKEGAKTENRSLETETSKPAIQFGEVSMDQYV